jgi:hypothetical protein
LKAETMVTDWLEHFQVDSAGTIIVSPSPHGDYKSGISYSDACALGEIYATFRRSASLEVRISEVLGNDICKNLILVAGGKANPVSRRIHASYSPCSTFDLEDGVLYDREKSVLLTTQYVSGRSGNIDRVTADYGLLVYRNNPFGRRTKVLSVAGIRGCGTLGAAIAVSDPRYRREIQELIRQKIGEWNGPDSEPEAIEVVVRVAVSSGTVQRDALTIEKVRVHRDGTAWNWESDEYRRLSRVSPCKLIINVIERAAPEASILKISIDDREIKFSKSPDRLKLIRVLAERAKDDYFSQSPREGWVTAHELADAIWHMKSRNGVLEIPNEIRREVSNVIITWARHMERHGNLRLAEDSKIDHDYVNSEILVFDIQIKKKIADLVYLINQDERNGGTNFHLIESQPGLGYRINIHPARLFLNRTETSARRSASGA